MIPRGGKQQDVRLVGHSTLYHPESNSLIVYGGILADAARFSKLSDRLFAFDLDRLHWTELFYPRGFLPDLHIPLERAFHSAVIMGPYMVVFGGYTHKHNREEICYDSGLYFYHLGCHTWVSHHILDSGDSVGSPGQSSSSPPRGNLQPRGIFSFASAVKDDNILLVFGGYQGSVTGDLLAYVMPLEMVGGRERGAANCQRHPSQLSCTSNPTCGWCPSDGQCYQRTSGANCTSNLQTTQCPGICPALSDCFACTIHGSAVPRTAVTPPPPSQCEWCVQTAKCHKRDDNLVGVCGAGMETPSGIIGWWGNEGTDITAVEECRTRDFRPGLTYLLYEHPANFSQPDEVSIVNSTLANFQPLPKLATPQQHKEGQVATGATLVARMLGFIHPLASKVRPVNDFQQEFKIMMDSSYASSVLRISLDDTAERLETVAAVNVNDTNTSRVEAARPDRTPIFPDPSRGHRYMMEFTANRSLAGSADHLDAQREISRMQLVWNGKSNYRKMFTFEYVEPYSNGSCHLYTNCMQCLADSLCGWCEPSRTCLPRIAPPGAATGNETVELPQCYRAANEPNATATGTAFLTLNPQQCVNCSNHISCDQCVGDSSCEWLVDDAFCMRRGRFAEAVKSVAECPAPCHERKGCSSCLGDPGRCTWCEDTQTCFVFSSYTSLFQFGKCREWVDVEPSISAQDAARSSSTLRGDLGQLNQHVSDLSTMMGTGKSLTGSLSNSTFRSGGTLMSSGAAGRCKACERKQSCASCLMDLSCGWCYYSHNPLIGLCKPGDFQNPAAGKIPLVASFPSNSKY